MNPRSERDFDGYKTYALNEGLRILGARPKRLYVFNKWSTIIVWYERQNSSTLIALWHLNSALLASSDRCLRLSRTERARGKSVELQGAPESLLLCIFFQLILNVVLSAATSFSQPRSCSSNFIFFMQLN